MDKRRSDINLDEAKEDLKNWDWGFDGELQAALLSLCAYAGAIVLEQIHSDFSEQGPNIDLDGDDLVLWKLSGDHFLVQFNLSEAVAEEIDLRISSAEERAIFAIKLRELADRLSLLV